jgi:predicted N-acetyltransferase YhbS
MIRPATVEEIPAIGSMIAAAFAQYRHEAPVPLFDAYLKESRNVAARWHIAQVLVAEIEGGIVGTVSFFADASAEGVGLPKGWAGFRTLAVHPAARGRGIARALARTCVEAAHARNTRTVGIHTAAFMKTACGIYEQMGFRRCPQHDLSFSAALGVELGAHDIALIAYRLDLADN